MLTFFFLPFFATLIATLTPALAEAPRPPREGTWEARASLSYFDTTQNFTSNGAETLPNGLGYTNMLGDFRFTYDYQADWRFYSGLNAAKAESSTNSNMGINEVYFGAENWYEAGKFDIAPAAEFIYPLWRVDEGSDSPALGEGAMRLRAGSWAFYPLKQFKPFAYIGYEYRDEGRAHVVPYSLGVKMRVQRFWIQGEIRGYETVMKDDEAFPATGAGAATVPNRFTYWYKANSGSQRYFAVNPSYSELAAETGTRFGDWGIFAGFAYSVNGMNTAAGWTGYGGVTFSPKAMHRPNEKRDETFDPRGEKYDESVFRESAPSRPAEKVVPEPEVNDTSEPPPDEAPAPTDTPRSAAPPADVAPPPRVQMQLQLRRVTKKKPVVRKKKVSKKLENMMDDAEKFLEKAK